MGLTIEHRGKDQFPGSQDNRKYPHWNLKRKICSQQQPVNIHVKVVPREEKMEEIFLKTVNENFTHFKKSILLKILETQ